MTGSADGTPPVGGPDGTSGSARTRVDRAVVLLSAAAAMLTIAPAAASAAVGVGGCDIFLCGGNHNEGAAEDRPGTAEPAEICTVSECGTNHNEGAARDGIEPG